MCHLYVKLKLGSEDMNMLIHPTSKGEGSGLVAKITSRKNENAQIGQRC